MSWAGADPAPKWLDVAREFTSGRLAASVRLDAETAWRLCTRGVDPGTALAQAHISGEHQIAEAACQIVSIVY